MIQRIQTLYLLLAACCCAVMIFFSPLWFETPETSTEVRLYEFDMRHLHEVAYSPDGDLMHLPDGKIMNTWGLPTLSLLIAGLCLLDMLLFHKRIAQARLNILTVCCCLGYYAMLAMYGWFAVQRLGVEWHMDWPAAMPLVAMVLVLMATRRILQDEALVRSADRLR